MKLVASAARAAFLLALLVGAGLVVVGTPELVGAAELTGATEVGAGVVVGAALDVGSVGRTVGLSLLLPHPISRTALTSPTVTAAGPREVIRMAGILDEPQAFGRCSIHRVHPFGPTSARTGSTEGGMD